MQQKKTICFVDGKSGGHIIPCLTLAQQYKNNTIIFFSTNAYLDQSILKDHPLITKHVALPLGTLYSSHWYQYPMMLYRIFSSFCKSLYHLYTMKPKIIISTGGMIALPVCFAAKLLHIPIELYELNATPGKATKLLVPLARNIYVSFVSAAKFFPPDKCNITHYPIRFTQQDKQIKKENALQYLGLDLDKKTLFILGGSQGSIFLNNVLKDFILKHPFNNIQIIHQTGVHDKMNWQDFYRTHAISAYVFSYSNHIAHCYIAADLVISRAGAGSLFEIHFFNKSSIIIPLEIKQTNHQCNNAYAITQQYPHLFTMMHQHEILKNKTLFFDKVMHKIQ